MCISYVKELLHAIFKQCLADGEMTDIMKQGVITLIPKLVKDNLKIGSWRTITLQTIKYKKRLQVPMLIG